MDGTEDFDREFKGMKFGIGFPPSGAFEGGDDGFNAFRAFGMAFEGMVFVTGWIEVDEGVHELVIGNYSMTTSNRQ
jgi:hypothetical protein